MSFSLLFSQKKPCLTTVSQGMNFESYFLSFARLARRSAAFWGHAVTSGVITFDGIHSTNGISAGESDDLLGNTGRVGRDMIKPNEVGGIDYFVSSWLFEDNSLGRLAQRKYGERSVTCTKHCLFSMLMLAFTVQLNSKEVVTLIDRPFGQDKPRSQVSSHRPTPVYTCLHFCGA